MWDPHRNNKCQAPGFYSALQNTLVQQLFVNSADEKQETKLLWTTCIMSLGYISLQNSELFLAQPQAMYYHNSFLSVNYVFLPSPHHYSYPVVDAIDAGDREGQNRGPGTRDRGPSDTGSGSTCNNVRILLQEAINPQQHDKKFLHILR